MNIKKKVMIVTVASTTISAIIAYIMSKQADIDYHTAELMKPIDARERGLYEKYLKRAIDIASGSAAIIFFSPFYLGVALLVKFKLGSPVLFTQYRPGLIGRDGKETIFKIYKFRTMTDERDGNGNLLPDEFRLTKFGAWLRSTSLDELPEAFNLINGTMSVIGPRPQLVRDMTFMTEEQRQRHTAKPGISGLAQINGRNAVTWEDKLNWDLLYIKNVNLMEDIFITIKTVVKAFIKKEGITEENKATAEDFGDYLLRTKKIDQEYYDKMQQKAIQILN